MLLVLSVLVIAGGYVIWLVFRPVSPAPVASPFASGNIVKPSGIPESKLTNDDLLGLSFELPTGHKVIKETEEEYSKRANGQIRKNFNYYVLYNPAEFVEAFYVLPDSENNPDKAILAVWVFENPEDLDPGKFYGRYWYYPFVWGDFTARKNEIAPGDIELIDAKEGRFGVVDYREGKPKFIYLPLGGKGLMLQIQYPDGNSTAKEILKSFKFE